MNDAVFEPGDLVVPDMSNPLGEQLAHSGFVLGEVVVQRGNAAYLIHHLIDTNTRRVGLEIYWVGKRLKRFDNGSNTV